MSYDPRACGAQCDLCPLQDRKPVTPWIRDDTQITVIASTPAAEDEKHNRPLIGKRGQIFDIALNEAGVSRSEISLQLAILCRPPDDDLKKVNRAVAKQVREGKHVLTPLAACRPRLLNELGREPNIISLGYAATFAVLPSRGIFDGKTPALRDIRGTFIQIPMGEHEHDAAWISGRKIMPTWSPRFVQLQPKWQPVFHADVDRAFRWFRGKTRWVEPAIFTRPTLEQIQHVLSNPWHWTYEPGQVQRTHIADIETDGIDTQTAQIRCLGVGHPDAALVIPLISAETGQPVYSPREYRQVLEWIAAWCEDRTILKVGHNFGVFDKQTLRAFLSRELGRPVSLGPVLDTIQLARMCYPELDRGLKFLASFLLDVRAWAEDKGGLYLTDEELWLYNGRDVALNGQVLISLWSKFQARSLQIEQDFGSQYAQRPLLNLDHRMQEACVGMERQGMLIDQERRTQHFNTYKAQMLLWANRAMKVLSDSGLQVQDVVKRSKTVRDRAQEMKSITHLDPVEAASIMGLSQEEQAEGHSLATLAELGLSADFNPGSPHQLRAILFDEALWNLDLPSDMQEKELYTLSGEVSTSDAVLRRLLMNRAIPKEQRKFIQAIRMYRRASKLLGTYILPVRPLVGDEKLDRGCVLHLDGRVHPRWMNHGPVTGRFASAVPNAQNWPAIVKDMVIAGAGRALVGADMDQLEFRIAAARWGSKPLLDAFARSIDTHQVTMRVVFPDEFEWLEGQPSQFGLKDFEKGSPFDKMRQLAKTVQYLSQYGGSLEALYRTLTAVEDQAGRLIYAHLTMQDAARLQENWKAGCAEFLAGWEREMSTFHRCGYLIEPVTGRRRDFSGSGKLNEVVNFPIQASGAGIMNQIMSTLMEHVEFGQWGPGTGIINQCHDSITLEVPLDKAQWAHDLLMQHMNVEVDAYPTVKFTAEADIGVKKTDLKSRWSYT